MASTRSQTLLLTAVAGLAGGAVVALFAFLLARYGPAGDGWSFKGNGALTAYTLIPVLLAAGWSALVLHARSHRGWISLGLGLGLVGLGIAFLGAAMLPLFGNTTAAGIGTAVLLIALVAWVVVAPAIATRARTSTSGPSQTGTHFAAAAIYLVTMLAGLYLLGLVIPAGS